MLTVIRFSADDCPACQCMARFDARVASEIGAQFIDVNITNLQGYQRYRKILMHRSPRRRELHLPIYVLVGDPRDQFSIQGEISGFMTEEKFRNQMDDMLVAASGEGHQAVP